MREKVLSDQCVKGTELATHIDTLGLLKLIYNVKIRENKSFVFNKKCKQKKLE